MGILEKIAEIEREIARTQKNKGNEILMQHTRKNRKINEVATF